MLWSAPLPYARFSEMGGVGKIGLALKWLEQIRELYGGDQFLPTYPLGRRPGRTGR